MVSHSWGLGRLGDLHPSKAYFGSGEWLGRPELGEIEPTGLGAHGVVQVEFIPLKPLLETTSSEEGFEPAVYVQSMRGDDLTGRSISHSPCKGLLFLHFVPYR